MKRKRYLFNKTVFFLDGTRVIKGKLFKEYKAGTWSICHIRLKDGKEAICMTNRLFTKRKDALKSYKADKNNGRQK